MPLLLPHQVAAILANADAAVTNDAKGKAFEDLVCCIFATVPGITVARRNQIGAYAAEEIDVAFWNDQFDDGLYFLPNILLVECKNWSDRLGSEHVAWFDAKLRARGHDIGILVAANGITGDPARASAAQHVVSNALGEGRKIIVITRTELSALADTPALINLIKGKLCELAVDGSLVL